MTLTFYTAHIMFINSELDSFDAVTAFNSVQYASDPVRGLREIKRIKARVENERLPQGAARRAAEP